MFSAALMGWVALVASRLDAIVDSSLLPSPRFSTPRLAAFTVLAALLASTQLVLADTINVVSVIVK